MINIFPVKKTENLVLRKAKLDDIVLYNTLSDPETSRYEFWQPHQTADDTQRFLEAVFNRYANGKFFDWVIEHKADKKPIGMVSLHDIYPRHARADIGFWLNKNYRNKGYATEAASVVIKHAFNNLGFERIQGLCSVDNPASMRVLEKLGMEKEACLKKYVRLNYDISNLSDVFLYVIFPKY